MGSIVARPGRTGAAAAPQDSTRSTSGFLYPDATPPSTSTTEKLKAAAGEASVAPTMMCESTREWKVAVFQEGSPQFHNRKYTFTGVPPYLLDSVLFLGPCEKKGRGLGPFCDEAIKIMTNGHPVKVYILVANGNGKETCDKMEELLSHGEGWDHKSECEMSTGSFKMRGFHIFSKHITGDLQLTLNSGVEMSIALKEHEDASCDLDTIKKHPGCVNGTREWKVAVFQEGSPQFHDRKYKLTGVPPYLLDSVLFSGHCSCERDEAIKIMTNGHPVKVYILVGNGNGKGTCDKMEELLSHGEGWDHKSECEMSTGSFNMRGFHIFSKHITGDLQLTLNAGVEMSIALKEHEDAPPIEPKEIPPKMTTSAAEGFHHCGTAAALDQQWC